VGEAGGAEQGVAGVEEGQRLVGRVGQALGQGGGDEGVDVVGVDVVDADAGGEVIDGADLAGEFVAAPGAVADRRAVA
jgi:hypothetical protein